MMSSVRGGAKPRWTPPKTVTCSPVVWDTPMPGMTRVRSVSPVTPAPALASRLMRSKRTCSSRTPGVTVQPPNRNLFSTKLGIAASLVRRLLSTSPPERAVGVFPFSCRRSCCSKCARTPKSVSLVMPKARWWRVTARLDAPRVIFPQSSFVAARRVQVRHAPAQRDRRNHSVSARSCSIVATSGA